MIGRLFNLGKGMVSVYTKPSTTDPAVEEELRTATAKPRPPRKSTSKEASEPTTIDAEVEPIRADPSKPKKRNL